MLLAGLDVVYGWQREKEEVNGAQKGKNELKTVNLFFIDAEKCIDFFYPILEPKDANLHDYVGFHFHFSFFPFFRILFVNNYWVLKFAS